MTDAWNKTERTITPPPDFTRNAMFLAEMDAFVRLCQGEDLPHCTLADGKRVQKIVDVARQSAGMRGCTVQLPS